MQRCHIDCIKEDGMNDLDLCFMPPTALADTFKAKTVSPVEVVRAVMPQVTALEPKLSAFTTFTPERALGASQRSFIGQGQTS